jgi:cysteinyl-tRNA synthetase
VIRYVLLASHYRKPIDWNEKALNDAKKALDSFYRALQESGIQNDSAQAPQVFMDTLLDDLNTPKSFAIMHEYAAMFNKTKDPNFAKKLQACGKLLGFLQHDCNKWFTNSSVNAEYIETKIAERSNAKSAKNWQLADQIRNELKQQGIIIEDKPDGSSSWRTE